MFLYGEEFPNFTIHLLLFLIYYLAMNKLLFLFFCTCFFAAALRAQNPLAYKIFNGKGKATDYEEIIKECKNADIIFFGELHNNPIIHWLQLELTKDIYSRRPNLVLGAEMFESDNQILINEYFLGHISQKSFESEARIWNNYATDYRPLLEFAKSMDILFVATNVPRRYASMVNKKGLAALEELPSYSKIYLPALPIPQDMNLKCYKDMLNMANGDMKFPQAQMIKDATMAYNISKHWQNGQVFLHFNGAFHSDNHEGIIWYLRKYNPDFKIVVISSVEQDNIEKLSPDYYQKGNFIIATPSNMTKTY